MASEDGLAWTKEFKGVPAGKYTVTESNAAIPGHELVEAESTVEAKDVEVTKSTVGDEAALAALEDVYERQAETGDLVIEVSKVATRAGEELAGAHIQILDTDGKVVKDINGDNAEWDSQVDNPNTTNVNEGIHKVIGLKGGQAYTLHETVAPNGYSITTDTTFFLNEDGTIDAEKTNTRVSDEGVLLVEDDITKITISKVAAGAVEELAGAQMKIVYRGDTGEERTFTEWTSGQVEGEDGPHVVEGLKTGVEYTLIETTAPDGYAIATSTTFMLKDNGTIDADHTTSKTTGTNEILVEDAPTKVSVSKVAVGGGDEIAGASIKLMDAEGKNVIKLNGEDVTWTSEEGKTHDIIGLKPGTYVLRETVAPDGYAIATDIVFTLNANGSIKTEAKTSDSGAILIEDAKTSVRVSKTDVADGEEIPGATIQIIDSEGNVVEQWVSAADDEATEDVNEAIHTIEGLKTGVTYTLKETVAPDGYTIATETTFTIDEKGKVTTTGSTTEDGILLVEDALTKVTISKADITDGKELEGAQMSIQDAEGNVVKTVKGEEAKWTSTAEPKVIEGLKTGVEYTLVEEVAPHGYKVTTSTTFVIDEHGKVTTTGTKTVDEDGNEIMVVEDEITSVKVSKVDIAGGEELEGAHIQVIDSEGKVVEEWVSTKEVHEITGLKTGVEYTLRETVAPDGYAIATDTTFSITADGTVVTKGTMTDGGVILIEDALLTGTGTISLKKELVENIPWQTDEEFEFTLATEDGTKVEIIKVKADEEKSFKTLSFDKPGTYYYTITETKGDTLHVTYDTETKWAKVEAKANEAKTALDITVTYGTSKEACTEDTLVITNVYAAPALEKYINKDVHQDLPAFDTPFTYDILAFVTNDAERVVIKDPLVQGIRFLDGVNTEVTVQDIGTENDHTAHGTVEKAQGTPVGEFTAKVDTTNKLLTVDIPKAEEQGLRGHWVRVTYQVILDNEIVGVEEEYEKNDEDVGDNHTVISKDYPEHDGVKTGANYIVYAENGDYPLEANDITVTPPTKTTKVTKAWVDAQGKEIAWPKDAKVTIELLGNGKSLKEATAEVLGKGNEIDNMTVTLDANNPTKTFTDVPIYESITYTVKEIKVEGVPEGFANTCVSTGNVDEGFKVTNTLKKDDTKKDDTKKDDTKKDDTKKDDGDTGNSNKGGSTNTTGGTTGSSRTGGGSTTSERLASTGDPTAETSLLTMLLTGIGSALVGGGVFLRRRKRDEER